jgi:hypothetical protein
MAVCGGWREDTSCVRLLSRENIQDRYNIWLPQSFWKDETQKSFSKGHLLLI